MIPGEIIVGEQPELLEANAGLATVGDRVRLADTELFIEVERDLIAEGGGYGNEIKFGGGKVIRDGLGQSPTATDAESLDIIITNALILDPALGVIKADIGKKDMVWNDATPKMEVDPETYTVKADGRVLRCDPLAVLPLAQRYFLF